MDGGVERWVEDDGDPITLLESQGATLILF